MLLFLVRHGEAKSKEINPDRHLTDNGKKEVEKTAEFMKSFNLQVHAVWHSGKTRAEETAQLLGEAFTIEDGIIAREGLTPNSPTPPIRDEIIQLNKNLMIVGHLPFMGKLASLLLSEQESPNIINFEECGILCLERGENNNQWFIHWLISPGLIL